jgi:hypothetical protein
MEAVRLRLLLRENASRGEKIFMISFLVFTVMVVYGWAVGFRPSDELWDLSPYLAIPASLLFIVPALLDRHPVNQLRTMGWFKKLFVFPVFFLLSYLAALIGVAVAIPAVVTRLAGDEFAGEYKVTARGTGYYTTRNSCDGYAIHLKGSSPGKWATTKLCLGEEFWREVKVGDVVLATGHQSRLGVLLEGVTLRR